MPFYSGLFFGFRLGRGSFRAVHLAHRIEYLNIPLAYSRFIIAALMHNDFSLQTHVRGWGQFFKVHVLADNVHKLFCVYGSFLCFGKLRLYSGNTLFQFLLFGFIVCRKLRETLVRNATAYAVLIQPLENSGKFTDTLFGSFQFLFFLAAFRRLPPSSFCSISSFINRASCFAA